MCNTDEHVDIGDVAQRAVPFFLKQTAGYGGYESFLAWWATRNKSATDNECFNLHNGASVSYGDILAMTGDFYASYQEMDSPEQSKQWDQEAKKKEIEMITSLYRKLGKVAGAHETKSGEQEQGDFFVHVALLATTNFPHFAPDAISTWLEWHRKAIEIAMAGREARQAGGVAKYKAEHMADGPDPSLDPSQFASDGELVLADSLVRALKYNAFADHFLSDMWAAGHMRVMRRQHKLYFDTSFIDFSRMLKVLLNNWAGVAASAKSVTVQQLLQQMANYPGIDLGDITSGIHHDEDGNRGLWYRLLLGDTNLPGLDIDDADFSGPVGDVFALGDGMFYKKVGGVASGGDRDGKNERNLKICYTAIRLSVRDVCLASALGSQFADYRKTPEYWKALGDTSVRPLYAPLRLYPKPNAPDGKFSRSFSARAATKSNHFPLVAPGGDPSKLEARYQAFKAYLLKGTVPSLTEACWLRKVEPVQFDPIVVQGMLVAVPDLPVKGTALTPRLGAPDDYWDLKGNWPDGSTPIDRLSDKELNIERLPTQLGLRKKARDEITSGWRFLELGRIIGEYVDLKFNPGQHYDCDP